MIFYCPEGTRDAVVLSVVGNGGKIYPFKFEREGGFVVENLE